MGLTLLLVAFPFAPVGPNAVGGAEQVLSELERGITDAGHRTWLLACAGSFSYGTLIAHGPAPKRIDSSVQSLTYARVRTLIEHTLHTRGVDLVHFHGVDFASYLPNTERPLLATLHLPPRLYPARAFAQERTNLFLNCVSESQHASCPASSRLVAPIVNGVRLEAFVPRPRKGNYLLSLGRICPEKGYHHALLAARDANLPLLLAGRVFPYPEHQQYFEHSIVPLLDRERRFLGPVGPRERARLLSGARCLVIPSLIEETSSLVAMEALASGTPVVAMRRGALPEVVEHGHSGLLVNEPTQLAGAFGEVSAIDPKSCRRAAEERFSSFRMVAEYLELYRQLAGRLATSARPKTTATSGLCGRAF